MELDEGAMSEKVGATGVEGVGVILSIGNLPEYHCFSSHSHIGSDSISHCQFVTVG